MTRVISVRGRKRAELEADPDFVYVGRQVRFTTWTERSPWANPFKVGRDAATAEEVVRMYEDALMGRIGSIHDRAASAAFRRELWTLKGKALGCWCCDWNPGEPIVTPCHAIVLARLAEGETTTATTPFLAFGAEEIEAAWQEWRANCGPGALAACTGLTPELVRPHLGDFERRGYMNPAMMGEAIVRCGFRWFAIGEEELPAHGLLRVQWGGPWLARGVPSRVASIYTHWIAHKLHGGDSWIFDVNAGAWTAFGRWHADLVPRLTAATKRADGSYSFTHRWEVRRLA